MTKTDSGFRGKLLIIVMLVTILIIVSITYGESNTSPSRVSNRTSLNTQMPMPADTVTAVYPLPDHAVSGIKISQIVTPPVLASFASPESTDAITLPPTQASFTYTPKSGPVPLNVTFTDTSDPTTIGWNWDFGDGNLAGDNGEQNPSHVYQLIGVFNVTLTAMNLEGSITSAPSTVNVTNASPVAVPVANFNGSPVSGNAPLTVTFDANASISDPEVWATWRWSFGDGTFSSEKNPAHTYVIGGNYTVSLTATNLGGSDVMTRTNYITVITLAPVANFTGTPTTGFAPLTVIFTDVSMNSPTVWNWSFGDRSSDNATNQHPVHTYVSGGTYTVSLNATNTGGSNTTTRTNYITVTPPTPVANFTSNSTSGSVPLSVQFNDTTTGSPMGWNWSFGDGNYSVVQNPVYTYTIPGTFTVRLNSTNLFSYNISIKSGYITAFLNPPSANFTSNVTMGGYNMTTLFMDTSTDIPTAWNWSFGDGEFSTIQNPVHTYTQIDDTPRWYNVSLNATNALGINVTEKTNYIHIMSFSEYYRSISGTSGNISTSTFVGAIEDWRLQRSVPTFTVSPSTSTFVGLIEDWRLQRLLL